MAAGFEMHTYMELEKPMIIAIRSSSAKRYAGTECINKIQFCIFTIFCFPNNGTQTGGIQLSSTSTTNYYLNPNVPETK